MAPKRRAFVRLALFALAVIVFCNFYHGVTYFIGASAFGKFIGLFSTQYPSKETLESLVLTEEQCRATFPGLTNEIDDAVARGPFDLKREPDDYTGLVQGRIKNGKLYVISAERQPSRDMGFERNSVLHQLHRAIVTSPEPIPDTLFTFSVLDSPRLNSWSFSRSNDPSIVSGNYWVMPHFSFWSWPLPFIGTLDQALAKINRVEKETPWEKKIDKVVWRGTAWFNSAGNTALRPNLLQVTKKKEWADVENLEWENNAQAAKNAIGIEDFCKYKYIIYTEGITYSGRLPFHQACGSIILTPPPNYLLHTTHLMRPLFSSSLPFSYASQSVKGPGTNPRWPHAYSPLEANIVFIDYDWTDLEQMVFYLRAHPDIAKGIAKRQRDAIARAGYLSPAAEACYWRSLIRGWSSVAKTDKDGKWGKWEDEGPEKGEGMRWEAFSLTEKTKWD